MPDNVPESLDAVLRKYGKIVIWWILFSAVAALSSFRLLLGGITPFPARVPFVRSEAWDLLQQFWGLLPSIGALAALFFLLQFLRYHILPIFFPAPIAAPAPPPAGGPQNFTLTGDPAGMPPAAPAPATATIPDGAKLLYWAFACLVIAMTLECLEVLLSMVYRAVA